MEKQDILDSLIACQENLQYLLTKCELTFNQLEDTGDAMTDFDNEKLLDLLESFKQKNVEMEEDFGQISKTIS